MAFSSAEVQSITALATECAQGFYDVQRKGKSQGEALLALVKVTLDLPWQQAGPVVDDVMARYGRLTDVQRQVVDPLVIAIAIIAHQKCLTGRALTAAQENDLARVCISAVAEVEAKR